MQYLISAIEAQPKKKSDILQMKFECVARRKLYAYYT